MNQPQAAQIEYTIYTFDMPVAKKKGDINWKKHSTITDMAKAMAEAETLLETRKFQKIEVKKKFFDQKKNRAVDMTLKVYEAKPKKDLTIPLAAACAMIGGGGAFAAAYFLTAGM